MAKEISHTDVTAG